MKTEEFKELLQGEVKNLAEDMEGKTVKQINEKIASLEEKMTDVMAERVKDAIGKTREETSKEIKENKEYAEELKKAVSALAAKMEEKKVSEKSSNKPTLEGEVSRLIEKHLKPHGGVIGAPEKNAKLMTEVKAVADMTLGNNLTGDQPRSYSNIVREVPGQLLHFADLIEAINIEGGTYTFPRETGSEGSIATQVEGSDKSQIDYDVTMVDVNTDFLAGYAVYSKKMANNLPFLESFLPRALRRDYLNAESSSFNTALASGATASTEVITSQNKIEMLIGEMATLEGSNEVVNGFVFGPSDFYDILVTEKSTGAGYGLPGVVTLEGGMLRINGVPVFKANWLAANKYYVGDWTVLKKVVTEGLSLTFADQDASNFRQNKITARIEAQIALAIERPAGIIYGDFTAV